MGREVEGPRKEKKRGSSYPFPVLIVSQTKIGTERKKSIEIEPVHDVCTECIVSELLISQQPGERQPIHHSLQEQISYPIIHDPTFVQRSCSKTLYC